jgi:hypothetical protein
MGKDTAVLFELVVLVALASVLAIEVGWLGWWV